MTNKEYCDKLVERIFDEWKKRGTSEKIRDYLGCSVIGHDCDMYLHLTHRGLSGKSHDGRTYRLFERGRREEDLFVSELRSIGAKVWEIDNTTGTQFAVSTLNGHLGGHLDGIATLPENPDEAIVVEFKTHSNSSFRKLVKHGVAEANPQHFAQMQIYMALKRLPKALYLAVNKNTDELYAEIVDFDREKSKSLYLRAKDVVTANCAEKCATSSDDYRCKMCASRDVCWNTKNAVLAINTVPCCRNCRHCVANIGSGAQWVCEKDNKPCGADDCCDKHQYLSAILSRDGERLVDEGIPSKTIRLMSISGLTKIDEQIQDVTTLLKGEIVDIVPSNNPPF